MKVCTSLVDCFPIKGRILHGTLKLCGHLFYTTSLYANKSMIPTDDLLLWSMTREDVKLYAPADTTDILNAILTYCIIV